MILMLLGLVKVLSESPNYWFFLECRSPCTWRGRRNSSLVSDIHSTETSWSSHYVC